MNRTVLNRNYWSEQETNELIKCLYQDETGKYHIRCKDIQKTALILNRTVSASHSKAAYIAKKLNAQSKTNLLAQPVTVPPASKPVRKPLQFHLPIEKLEIKEGNLVISVDASSLIVR